VSSVSKLGKQHSKQHPQTKSASNGFEAVVVAYARSAKAEDNLISRQKTTINRSASALGVTAAQTPVKKAAEVTLEKTKDYKQ